MRIAFGTSVLRQQRATGQLDGIGRYAGELLAALRASSDLDCLEYIHSDIAPTAPCDEAIDAGKFRAQALAALLAGRSFDLALRSTGTAIDLIHSPDHFVPLHPTLPVVATIHDAVPISHPEWNRYPLPRLRGFLWKRSAKWADRILTVSEHSKRNIVRCLGVPADRIEVTPLGVGAKWFHPPDQTRIGRVRAMHGLGSGYFLFLGVMQPRKNIARLLEAHRLLPADLRRQAPLVAAGPPGWGCAAENSAFAAGEGGTLRNVGQIGEEDLVPLVQGAAAVVLPSLDEGFGLPVLEAMAAGTPVVASSAGAIPEVAGDAAMLVDPLDVGALAEALQRIATDRSHADVLRQAGQKQARLFTWERTAALTAAAYRQVISVGKT